MSLERTDTIVSILRIVADLGGTVSHDTFGRRRWPDSANWRRAPGKQLKAAAGQLGRVASLGFLARVGRGIYSITDSGRSLLAHGGYPPPVQPQPLPWGVAPPFAYPPQGVMSPAAAYPPAYPVPQTAMYPQAAPAMSVPGSTPMPPAAPTYPGPMMPPPLWPWPHRG